MITEIPSGIDDVSAANPLAVYPVAASPVTQPGAATLVPSNTSTTVATYTPSSLSFRVTGFLASGDVNATYNLYVNGVLTATGVSSVAEPTSRVSFGVATPIASAGQTVNLKAIHFAGGVQGNFNGTLLGYLL